MHNRPSNNIEYVNFHQLYFYPSIISADRTLLCAAYQDVLLTSGAIENF